MIDFSIDECTLDVDKVMDVRMGLVLHVGALIVVI